MSEKKQTTFYLDPDVSESLKLIPKMGISKFANQLLRAAMQCKNSIVVSDDNKQVLRIPAIKTN